EFLVHRHGFLCATTEVTIGVGFQQSLGAGIFGGSGFMLQRVGGQGTAWLELSGELIAKNLAPGEILRVHPGHVGAFQASVGFNITTVPGIKNALFGGDGIFLAQLQGPGTIWLQTLPISRLAQQIAEYLPHNDNRQAAPTASGMLLGGIVGSILGGDQ
ncbi:MAG: AIM24 family protein, partial [Terracidiphilus sp.]